MKKPLLFAVCAVVLALVAAVLLLLPGGDAIAELNENSSLPVPLCTHETQALAELTESLLYVPGFGGYALDNDDICIHFGGWPDAKDEYHVIRIDLFSPGYHVLGLQVGDGEDRADQLMARYGYDRSDGDGRRAYTKGGVTVVTEIKDDTVARINVMVETTNQDNIVF